MSGHDLAARFRGARHHFSGVLIALTGFGKQEDVARALASGFDAHVTKPMDADALLNLLATHMQAEAQVKAGRDAAGISA